MKCFFGNNGINTNNFDYHSKSTTDTRLRRGKRKINGTTDITNEKLKESLTKDIASSLYTVRKLIVPQKFAKMKIDDQNKIVHEEFEVSDCKIPLLDMRKKHEKNKQFYRLFSEQRIKEMDRYAIIKELT